MSLVLGKYSRFLKGVSLRFLRSRRLIVFLSYVKKYNSSVTNVLFLTMIVCLCYQLAIFIWGLVPAKATKLPGLSASEHSDIQKNRNLVPLKSYLLFGEVVDTPKTEQTNVSNAVPKSKLDATIMGISASSDPKRGSVVVKYQNIEDVYGINDKIEKTNAIVKRIYPNKIIIRNNGVDEELMIPDDGLVITENFDTKKSTPQKVSKEKAKNIRTELLSNSSNIFKYISIKPATKNGKTIGYELNPGEESKVFYDAGLQNGDIAVEMNGYDLTNTFQAMKLMGEFQNLKKIDIVVLRDETRRNITLDLE